ncbi:hypothetical protein [Roseovarius salinarum]|uniref:hypothetical protein n=1 Tax=Roseovarius salinarum TaxID=1981892 RepID=UPI0018E459A5|nr:hypothetical protein [Roseovarius salinarum]
MPAETLAELRDGLDLAADALAGERLSRQHVNEARAHLRFAQRRAAEIEKGMTQ